ncbi:MULTISPECIES: GIY-YIG nuclease family protein [unclassified Tolypothrix]|nr:MULTISPECIES: GIY-YIG nuclease family protein [unclassified Tolypothrix]BAY89452.1 hypothetical protein NIES3275_14550 [Microchaete diplosiphon NIES-3275]EKF01817.1 hypothetical protein FDUTEX481_07422 [Tolypothrix sp. PCC 7601]MBE9083727.1 GIY-YIG nuclease family protein [Tolypothrix sp. LEGE 11397]UYD23738.1 GIY-YIG nuclease family protein [Tolypothrix sp. PCC 7712]UYD34038.1 GIY-YIG nuclease family protein [Tolypothrix sp. PCC 7601]
MSQFVYIVRSGETNRYKIGMTKNIYQRFKKLQGTDAPYYINSIHHIKVINSRVIEKYLHNKYKSYQVKGEWFELNENLVKSVVKDMDFQGILQLAAELSIEELLELQMELIKLCHSKIAQTSEIHC